MVAGGDGALLYELLKEKPKSVIMLEIDEMVMQACNKYLRSICGDVLEVRKNEQFEVWVWLLLELIQKIYTYIAHFTDYCRRLHGLSGEIH